MMESLKSSGLIDTIHNVDCMVGMKNIPNGSVDLILCDLPFGVSANKWDSVLPLDKLFDEYKRTIKRGGVICLFATMKFAAQLINACPEWFKYDLVWCKTHGTDFMNAKRKPLQAHESILVFAENMMNMTYNPQFAKGEPYEAHTVKPSTSPGYRIKRKFTNGDKEGKRYPLSWQRFKKEQIISYKLHPTQKPNALLEWLIKTYSNKDDVVLDNTCGSGSTLVAAVNTGRHYIGYELDKAYYEMAKENLKYAGRKQVTMFDEV